MAKVKCPECKRVGTYSPKFGQCSACGLGRNEDVTKVHDITSAVTESVTEVVAVTPTVTEPCSRCGCAGHVAKSGAERQKAWRARKKDG